MKTKSVFLKCRFGDHLPNAHKAVDLDKESAEYLITEGLAIENVESIGLSGTSESARVKELEGKVTALTTANGELEGKVTALTTANGELEGKVTALTTANGELKGQLDLLDPKPVVKKS